MYRIIKIDGTELGITDSVNYIKIGESGSYINATETDAIGVAYNSEPYNLIGHDDIELSLIHILLCRATLIPAPPRCTTSLT